MTIETKITKSGRISLNLNGERANKQNVFSATYNAILNGEELTIVNENGNAFTFTGKRSARNHTVQIYTFTNKNGDKIEVSAPISSIKKTFEHIINNAIDNIANEYGIIKAEPVAEEIADKTVTFYPTDTPKPCTGKLFGYDVCEYHSVEEYISELKITQIAVIMENLFKNEDGSFSYDGWGRKTYYMTDCYREAYYGGGYYNEITLDAESTTQLIYAEQQLKNIVNGSDGSEEDIDGDNVFDYLPALDELNDVDINDDDNTPPDNEPMSDDIDDICNLTPEWRIYRTEDDAIVEKLTVNGEELTFINGAPNHIHSDTYKAGFSYFSCKFYSTDKKYKTIHEEEEFFAIMADRGACTIDDDNTPPDSEPMSDDISDICKYNPDIEDDDKSCRLDWDDSAIAHIPTGEEELAAFINPQIVIEEGYLEPADKIVTAKPKLTRKQIQKMIDGVIDEREEYFDALDEALADDEVPQRHIDYLNDMLEKLSNEYWELLKLYDNAPAEEIAD